MSTIIGSKYCKCVAKLHLLLRVNFLGTTFKAVWVLWGAGALVWCLVVACAAAGPATAAPAIKPALAGLKLHVPFGLQSVTLFSE